MSKARHSGFRVVALLLLLQDDTETTWTNDEASPCLSSTVPFQRHLHRTAALLQYRRMYGLCWRCNNGEPPLVAPTQSLPIPITAVYIVSDHPESAIAPGCLCREYLYGHPAVDPATTRMVLQSADVMFAPVTRSLTELYPYPSVAAWCTADAINHSNELQPRMESLVVGNQD